MMAWTTMGKNPSASQLSSPSLWIIHGNADVPCINVAEYQVVADLTTPPLIRYCRRLMGRSALEKKKSAN